LDLIAAQVRLFGYSPNFGHLFNFPDIYFEGRPIVTLAAQRVSSARIHTNGLAGREIR
jgi:hypothetical protein